MNLTPKSVFTGKESNGEKITFFEWDYNTWAGFEFINNLFSLLIALLLSAIASPILLVFAVIYFNGRNKPLYTFGLITSAYFLYDCSHGWLVLAGINLLLEESTINFLVGLNIASLVLFSLFFLFGKILNNLIEGLTPTLEGRWIIFIIFVSVIIVTSVVTTCATKNNQKGWIMANLRAESESSKKDRLEREKREEIGDFESKEARDKYFLEQEKRWGN